MSKHTKDISQMLKRIHLSVFYHSRVQREMLEEMAHLGEG